MTVLARAVSLALLSTGFAAIGCGQQDEPHTNTGPVTNSNPNTPTPATDSEPVAPASGARVEPAPAPAPAEPAGEKMPSPAPSAENAPAKSAAVDGAEVVLEKISYDALRKRLAENPSKAKYTMVDAWATWCLPCKENFPHVVEMHHKYGGKGLAVASLSFDDPSESKVVEDARTFLREKKATFANYLLDEEFGVGFDKLNFGAVPAVFLFGPDGKEVRRFTLDDPNNQFTYDEVEKAVVALLESK